MKSISHFIIWNLLSFRTFCRFIKMDQNRLRVGKYPHPYFL